MKSNILLLPLFLVGLIEIPAQTIMNIHQDNGTVLQIPLNTIDSITYTITAPENLATVTTFSATNIDSESVVAGGSISSNGGTPVTERGFCWSTNPGPSLLDNSSNEGSGVGDFSNIMEGLSPSTMYYLRAYATNSAGVAYGNEVSFTTNSAGSGIISNPGPGVVFDGYNYASVILGNGQEWMAENLRTNTYANGDPIPNVMDGIQWNTLVTGAWVHYENSSQFEDPYGKLYNWYAVDDSRNLCPSGWHVPTDEEITNFIDYLGGPGAGGMIKSTGTQYWQAPNTGATNESGFNGLPGGFREPYVFFDDMNEFGLWWSSTEDSLNDAWFFSVNYLNTGISEVDNSKNFGLSVRCVKN